MAETFELQVAALIEREGKRMVEMIYAEKPAQDFVGAIGMTLRLPIEQEFPLLQEAELEALRRVRDLVRDEIQRIEKMGGPVR
jgi:hypothetical protein